MRPLLIALPLLLAAPLMAQGPTFDFLPRAAPEAGQSWLQRASWTTKGHTVAKLGPVKVRNKKLDNKVAYSCGIAVQGVEEAVTSEIGVRCLDALYIDHGEAEDLPVTGVDVLGIGIGPERVFSVAEGRKLKKDQREFFERNFRDRTPDQPDPLEFLLPGKPVGIGDTWHMDLDGIQAFFGRDRFTMDMEQSYARVTLTELVERNGEQFGRLAFWTVIVPATITDGDFTEARMELEGAALLPLRGDLPYQELDLAMDIRFLGSVKAKGVKVNLDLDTALEGYEKKEPSA
jgi:hypothetical protein